ncbi:lantibiotic dehydratase [Chromobacterium vaccinii]|uniref:lantibiotic dehydratase n=1 Tax=Chromobacterium vaccinii TaxID=1108595 RepID=UPI0031E3C056
MSIDALVDRTPGNGDSAEVRYFPQASSHLTPASPLGWRFWRTFCIRGAGFPARWAADLADSGLARAADLLAAGEASLELGWREAERIVQSRVDGILSAHGVTSPGDKPEVPFPDELALLRRAAGSLRRRRLGQAVEAVLPGEHCRGLAASLQRREVLASAFRLRYAAALESLGWTLRETAGQPLFRQAIAWQNHAALPTALDPLMRDDKMPGAKLRQRQDLVANYTQRYCVKNDTIGFFGPIAWGQVHGDGNGFHAVPGPGSLAERNLYFEDWPIAAVADTVAADNRFVSWLTPRMLPYLRLDGRSLVFPGGVSVEVSAAEHELLRQCDGHRKVRQIVSGLLANPFSCFQREDEVHDLLRRLQREARIDLGFQVPGLEARPERALRAQFEAIGDAALREEALSLLDRLESARGAVASAAGQAEALAAAQSRLDAEFEAVTGVSARRRHGEAYGGRAIIYEDCRRDFSMDMGEPFLLGLQQSLDLVLMGSRWFMEQVARGYLDALREVFMAHAAPGPQGALAIDAPTFWLHAQRLFFGDGAPIRQAVEELGARWRAIFEPFNDERRIEVEAEEIFPAVSAAFSSCNPLWRRTCYQCPDLMLCGEEPDAAGGMMAVLGEIHVGGHTLLTNGFLGQHPDPEWMLAARRRDSGTDNVVPKLNGEGARRPIRTQWKDDPLHGVEVLFSQGARPFNPRNAMPLSALEIIEQNGELLVRSRDGGWQRGLLELFADFIFLSVANDYLILPKGRHTPRVTVGGVVWQREGWRLPCSEFDFMLDEDDARVFLGMRRKAAEWGMPGRVFVKVPWENKPFYLDFDSPLFVRHMAKQLRGALQGGQDPLCEISISEMLPDFEHLWLKDRDGELFTSELRMVALHQDDARPAADAEGRQP